jgi:hypothetical protein
MNNAPDNCEPECAMTVTTAVYSSDFEYLWKAIICPVLRTTVPEVGSVSSPQSMITDTASPRMDEPTNAESIVNCAPETALIPSGKVKVKSDLGAVTTGLGVAVGTAVGMAEGVAVAHSSTDPKIP